VPLKSEPSSDLKKPSSKLSSSWAVPGLSSIFGASSNKDAVRLDVAWPHPLAATLKPHHAPPESSFKISTLKNGMRVMTNPTPSSTAHLVLCVSAGPRFEDDHNRGISYLFENLSLSSTTNRSSFRLVRDLSKIGANLSSSLTRESISLHGVSLPDFAPDVLDAMADAVRNPAFEQFDLIDALDRYRKMAEDPEMDGGNIQMMLQSDHIHATAYNHETLGVPVLPSFEEVEEVSDTQLLEYRKKFFTADRMVLSGCGIEHEELVALANEVFGTLPNGEGSVPLVPAKYVGGDSRLAEPFNKMGHTTIFLGFEGLSSVHPDMPALAILGGAMGGGGSFSAGGPGKGMYSRVYRNVLMRNDFVERCESYLESYSDTGLFGLSAACPPDKAEHLCVVMINELVKMTDGLTPVELERAKAQLKSHVATTVEFKNLFLEEGARQLMMNNKSQTLDELFRDIDKVTHKDIQRVARGLLSKPPTYVVFGDNKHVPRFDAIREALYGKGGNPSS